MDGDIEFLKNTAVAKRFEHSIYARIGWLKKEVLNDPFEGRVNCCEVLKEDGVLPCPFCQRQLTLTVSIAKSFDSPREYYYLQHASNDCLLRTIQFLATKVEELNEKL